MGSLHKAFVNKERDGGVVFLSTAPPQSALTIQLRKGIIRIPRSVESSHPQGRAPVTVILRPAVLAVVVGECSGVPAFLPLETISWG